MTQLVDDQLLSVRLRTGIQPRSGEELYSTGCWYVRLCQAALGATGRDGVLSSPFESLPAPIRQQALHAVLELPDDVGVLSLRLLGPLIGQLRRRHQLNILSIEALAAALYLEADVYLSAPSPRLEEALGAEGRSVQLHH